MTEITTSDLREEMAASLPDGYILSKDVVFPDKEIPIKAVINGQKVTVGSGRIDPETGVFTGTLDNEPNGEILRGQLEAGTFSYNPFLNVSELELSQVRQIAGVKLHSISLVAEEPNPKWDVYPIEKVVVSPTGHAIIEPQENSHGPTPRFHNHD